jgi:photosynthetic reaction center cytochrome c subunit
MLGPRRGAFLFAVVTVAFCEGTGFAQAQNLKNIQVLKGASRDQVVLAMGFISQSLGVTCDSCHVQTAKGFEFDRDDKEEKRTARRMLSMMKAINDQHFDGKQRVTCATCHHGQLQPPSSNPDVALETLQARAAGKREASRLTDARAVLPPARDLLAKYEQAIGGAANLAKLNTRVDEFTAIDPTGTNSGITMQKAPDQWIETTNLGPNRSLTWVCDGTSASIIGPGGTRVVSGLDLEYVKFNADFWRTLKLTDRYSKAATAGREKLDGHAVYVVDGEVKGSTFKERLYLDTDSGLLLRRLTYRPTLLGLLADQTDFQDYRTIDGIEVPFLVKAATGAFATTRTYTDIRFNVPVDDSKFAPLAARTTKVDTP